MDNIAFTPIVEFTWADSVYLPDLIYTARTEKLIEQVPLWEKVGMVKVVEGVPAALAGTGIVT